MVKRVQGLMEVLGGTLPVARRYRVKSLDGNHLAATERRLKVLRSLTSAPLPGQALVILDPALMLAIDVFACKDGHAQEWSLLSRVLATVGSGDLWIADRNFCTLGFLCGQHWRGAAFMSHQGHWYCW
ncbi:MAG: hypothetical protein NW224_18115 [Leptolyngbyaceae cyanobacterium bins.302]|nr:hypothetical protein [Leptolyngbyaceae cyanobacterium bins.302]